MIKVNALSCGYQKTVLQNITFECSQNIAILGANGVGKSTLAKALCGLLPFKGEITLNNKAIHKYTPQERAKTITYIPPKLSSFDDFISVEEFVLMGRYPHKMALDNYTTHDKERVQQLLQSYNIQASKSISELSSGQQQLILIAQALAQESQIIIFDEPTANLDPKHAFDFYKALQNLPVNTQKVLITHDLQFAATLGYSVLFLDKEGIHFYEDPTTFFTAENLSHCYGITFSPLAQTFGVCYE